MKRILCFGDSNTWGYIAGTNPIQRYDHKTRWTGVLREGLGEAYEVIEEGLNGRTTVWDDPIEGHKNGEKYLVPCLSSQSPLDLVIIMLGTNDTKCRFSLSAFDIAAGMEKLIGIIKSSASGRDSQAPKILLMCPAPVKNITTFAEMLEGAEEKSAKMGAHYAAVAQRQGCDFLDIGTIVEPSPVDGIHLDANSHRILGEHLVSMVKDILG